MTTSYLRRFKLASRVFHYRGGYRWIVTDNTQATFAHGQCGRWREARRRANAKRAELSSHDR